MAVEPPFREPPEDAPNPETFRAPESGFTPVEEGPQGEEYPSVLPVTAPAGEAPLAMLPKRPMPGFWLSALACFLMIFVTQIVVPLGVLIILIIVRLVRAGDFQSSLDELGTQAGVEELQRETMLPLLATAHVSMIFIGLLTLRLFAGRDWRRAVALRWPSVSHTLLLLVGFPAMPFVSGGVYLFAQRHIAGLAELPALLISQIAMVAVFGLAWLAACIVTGRDWKPELARSPLPVQWPVSLIVVVVGVAVASATFGLVAPHMPQLPFLEPLDKGMEDLARDMRLWHPALAVLVVAGCPALSEELWCWWDSTALSWASSSLRISSAPFTCCPIRA